MIEAHHDLITKSVFLFTKINAAFKKFCCNRYNNFMKRNDDLTDGLSSNTKLFADDTSLFSVIHDSVITTLELNSDLSRTKQWAFQWLMSFDPDLNKQAK